MSLVILYMNMISFTFVKRNCICKMLSFGRKPSLINSVLLHIVNKKKKKSDTGSTIGQLHYTG